MKKLLLNSLLLASIITNAQCWESVSNGETHVMGIKPNGTLWGWGRGDAGLNGNGGNFAIEPQQIGIATDWKSVHSGLQHSLGIKESGILWAWGSNNYGNLGTGSTAPISTVPVQVGTAIWKTVSAGGSHSLGIRTNGTLWGWGWNQNATVGDGTTINRNVPVLINNSTNWKMVSCSSSKSMAVKEDGTLWGWGLNAPFLGITSETGGQTLILIPTQIGTDTDWKSIAVGSGHYLGLKNNNSLWAWGGGIKVNWEMVVLIILFCLPKLARIRTGRLLKPTLKALSLLKPTVHFGLGEKICGVRWVMAIKRIY
jgi:alpha-tubulin suppressor-like RCC1 family protein